MKRLRWHNACSIEIELIGNGGVSTVLRRTVYIQGTARWKGVIVDYEKGLMMLQPYIRCKNVWTVRVRSGTLTKRERQ